MKLLFWNKNRNKEINKYILSLVKDNDIDMLVTAEYIADAEELQEMLTDCNIQLQKCNTIGSKRIDVWSSYVDVAAGMQTEYYSIQVINNNFILCGVHLMTDLHGDQGDERLVIIQQILQDIKRIEYEVNSHKVIIIGDMNEMPYDKGCLNANGFHGLPALNYRDREARTIKGNKYRKFYNPMWGLMGDNSYPPGTYYLNRAVLHCPMWYMMDQIIISKEVLPLYNKESLKIITSCRYADLKDKNRHPNKKISDHFPIVCEIKDLEV